VIISILYLLEGVWGRTYLQKLLFLLNTEVYHGTIFAFKEYKYGPFSIDINTAVTRLHDEHIIEEHIERTKGTAIGYRYNLTYKGRQLARQIIEKQLTAKEKKSLIEYTSRFRHYTPTELLLHVYHQYPEFTRYSIFEK
jgi:uncharacterized protein YwgA